MSTNINISVGDSKLLDQARQQQAASRQAQLEKEATSRLEAQATAERTKALAAQGKDANGNPLYGVPTPAPDIDRRPAANRFSEDSFGYFSYEITEVSGQVVFRIKSGDGNAFYDVPYPVAEEFGDLAAYPESPNAILDSQGRLVGGTAGLRPRQWLPVTGAPTGQGWAGPDLTVFESEGSHTGYWKAAKYEYATNQAYHILPIGKDAAIICLYLQDIKLATTAVVTARRTLTITQVEVPPGFDPNNPDFKAVCRYEESLAEDKDFSFHANLEEAFYAIYVSKSTVKFLGNAPSGWINKFKTLPGYAPEGFDEYNSSVYTNGWDSLEVIGGATGFPSGYCGLPPTSTTTQAYNDYRIRTSSGGMNLPSQAWYKLLNNPSQSQVLTTPSVYSVINNYSAFVASAPNPLTDVFFKSIVPAFAGNLKWRTFDNNKIPYTYTGIAPENWFEFSGGPASIRASFPQNWRKSGKQPNNISPTADHLFWDWNNPGYCRQQALALGFTEADLTP